jgi:hypothetical protein
MIGQARQRIDWEDTSVAHTIELGSLPFVGLHCFSRLEELTRYSFQTIFDLGIIICLYLLHPHQGWQVFYLTLLYKM